MTSVVAVLAHPREDSFCAALWAAAARQRRGGRRRRSSGRTSTGTALDPVLTARESLALGGAEGDDTGGPGGVDPLVARYQAELVAADRLLVVHPNWWGKPPAVLAGWLDRVLAPGVAYKLEGGAAGAPTGQLDLAALVVTTGDTAHDGKPASSATRSRRCGNAACFRTSAPAAGPRVHAAPGLAP